MTSRRAAAATAIASLDRAATTLLNAGVVDTFNLVDNLAHVVEDIVAVSPWRRLRDTDRWGGLPAGVTARSADAAAGRFRDDGVV